MKILKEKLEDENIETLYKYKGQTKELQGISFKIGNYKYKGSEIDRKFSIKNLEGTILQYKMQNLIKTSKTISQSKTLSVETHQGLGKHKEHNQSIVGELINPVKNDQLVTHHSLLGKKPKKKKSRGLHY